MDHKLKRRVAVGVTGLAVAAGGGIAFAATQSTSPQQERKAFLQDAATRLNTTPDKLESALKAAAKARVDQAVADGRLTRAQGDEIKQRIEQGGGAPFLGPGKGGPGPGAPGFGPGGPGFDHGGGPFGGLDAAASYLGLSEDKLFEQLRAGKSLADVAKAQGKSVDGLKSALSDAAGKRLDEAVKDKHLTQAQADRIKQKLDSHLDDLIAGKRPARPRFERGERHRGPWF
jgi:hypothetical protein